jgi:hypothetical protein
VTAPDSPDHGLEVVVGDGWVDLVDTQADGTPAVRFTTKEWDAFLEGVRRGDFDVDPAVPRPRDAPDGGG